MKTWTWPLPDCVPWEIPTRGVHAFGSARKHDIHSGVDLFAPVGQKVCAMEDGVVIRVEDFTGTRTVPPTTWWADTRAILVEGESGVVVYGEIQETVGLAPGDKVKQGQVLGGVLRVDDRDVPHPSMLHVELYAHGYRGETVFWQDAAHRPAGLLDPTSNLLQAWLQVTPRFHRNAPPIPVAPETHKKTIAWLVEHPLWHYPVTLREPPSGSFSDQLVDIPGSEDKELKLDDPTWVSNVYRIGGGFHDSVNIEFVFVDPTRESIVGEGGWDSNSRNTAFRIWLEAGGWMDRSLDPNDCVPEEGWTDHNKWQSCVDLELNCGGASLEEALLKLAVRVKFYYGDNGEDHLPDVPKRCDLQRMGEQGCVPLPGAGDGFCAICGFLLPRGKDDEEEAGEGTADAPSP